MDALQVRRRLDERRSAITDEATAALRFEGVWVTSVDRLLGDDTPTLRAAIASAAALAAECATTARVRWRRGHSSTDLAHGELLARLPALYMLGLNETLLSIAEQYLRVPAAYHGAVLRHSHVDGRQVGPRRWHRDAEDFHVLRSVLYLNDVDDDGGPFEYVPRTLQAQARRAMEEDGMCSDARMAACVPPERWKQCTGAAGTLVIADSAQVFHHESLQRGSPRTVLMMGHSSRRPRGRTLAQAHFPVHRHAATLAHLVPPTQHPHVFGWRRAETPGAETAGVPPDMPVTTIAGDFFAG